MILTPEVGDVVAVQQYTKDLFGILLNAEQATKLFQDKNFAARWVLDGTDDGDEIINDHLWEVLCNTMSPDHPNFLKPHRIKQIRKAAQEFGYTLGELPKHHQES